MNIVCATYIYAYIHTFTICYIAYYIAFLRISSNTVCVSHSYMYMTLDTSASNSSSNTPEIGRARRTIWLPQAST